MIKMKRSVEELTPYYVNDKLYNIKLNANEGSNYLIDGSINLNDIDLNLYPDSDASILREKMAKYYSCNSNNIIAGNGSSEIISMVINAYCDKSDKVLTFYPCFGMYEKYCGFCGAELVYVNTDENFVQNVDLLIENALICNPKIIILCNPNNPTGYTNCSEDIKKLISSIRESIVIIDEAYGDFMGFSAVEYINKYDNLIVTRTMSKAFGASGIRVGCGIGDKKLIEKLWKVKPPYNLNKLSQIVAISAFKNSDKVKEYIKKLNFARNSLMEELSDLNFTVYSSSSNFIFVKSNIADLDKKLENQGVLIKEFGGKLSSFYRITVVDDTSNKILLHELKEIMKNERG